MHEIGHLVIAHTTAGLSASQQCQPGRYYARKAHVDGATFHVQAVLCHPAGCRLQLEQAVEHALCMATAGVPPRVMGMGPVPATRKLCESLNLQVGDFQAIELNEAFAAQALACLRELGLPDDAAPVNPNGGAIALGHPLGMSGARLVMTLVHQLQETGVALAVAAV